MTDNIIQIIFATDNNYAPFVGLAIISLKENSKKNTKYSIYIIADGSVTEKNKIKIESLADLNIVIEFIKIEEKEIKSYYSRKHITSPAYFRFLIPDIFLEKKRVIYSDPDVLFMDDLTELWNVDLEGKALGAVPCLTVKNIKSNHYKKYEELAIPCNYNYCYDGNMIMDLDRLREVNFKDRIFNEAQNNNYVNGDMDIINKLFYEEFYCLDSKWTFWPEEKFDLDKAQKENIIDFNEYVHDLKLLEAAEENPRILHFAGEIKPWHYMYPENNYKKIYWKYIKKSPWKNVLSYRKAIDFNLKHVIKKEIISRIKKVIK